MIVPEFLKSVDFVGQKYVKSEKKSILCRSTGPVKNFLSDIILLFCNLPCPVKDKYSVMAGWSIFFSLNVTLIILRPLSALATSGSVI
jgi:hypothetical protein